MDKRNIKNLTMILAIILLFLSIVSGIKTYSLFESEIRGTTDIDIAKWQIEVNNKNVTKGDTRSFVIDKLDVVESEHALRGKITPGAYGKFSINIKPIDVDVSFKYEIHIDTSKINNKSITLEYVNETSNTKDFTVIDETNFKGIIKLENMKNDPKYIDNLNFILKWENNEKNNDVDTKMGLEAKNTFKIPVTILFTQIV